MTIKKNLPLKLLAFLLAVLAFLSFSVLSLCQIYSLGTLWQGADALTSRQVNAMMQREIPSIYLLLNLKRSAELTSYETAQLESLEASYALDRTNLRWQVRDEQDRLLYGNIDGEVPAQAYENNQSTHALDAPNYVTSELASWPVYAGELYTLEETPAQIRTEGWQEALAQAVNQWLAGDRTLDPDAVYTDLNDTTYLLIIDTDTGPAIYAPTIRNVLKVNPHGYQYSVTENDWNKTAATQYVTVITWLDPALEVDDDYRDAVAQLKTWTANRVRLLVLTGCLALVWLVLTVYLCVCSGWRKGHETISLCWFHRIPGDLLLAGYVGLIVLMVCFAADYSYLLRYGRTISLWQVTAVAGLFGAAAGMLLTSLLITFTARCKAGVILCNMILVRILTGFASCVISVVQSLPLIWKVLVVGAAYLVFSILFVAWNEFIWALVTLILLGYLCWWASQWQKLRQSTEEIIDGIIDCHIDTSKMPPDLKAHANELNNLGETIALAVDERMRSEHFKAELITNVSHDLKTPLTSIINYVDLLKKEEIDNPKVAEYIDVLERKSQRLKKLTEDLVEASKASTGNLTVVKERLDLVQLTDQALAEYQERLEGQNLSIVRTLPDRPVWILADGRHLWRIIDNLLSNCAKYALEGTRIYATVEQFFDCAELSIKNISRDALNIDPDTLMERFVRGDESRTLEGSGLGLSIARSLTDLQDGYFFISIDGDLFKATIRLPLAK